WKGRFCGQRQKWLCLRFLGEDADISIETEHPEFDRWQWMGAQALLDSIVPFKRAVYGEVLGAFREWVR
ncbi:MAG: RNA pyrophosphohydrolase, partial [Candidatus Paceibacteria bacterium]